MNLYLGYFGSSNNIWILNCLMICGQNNIPSKSHFEVNTESQEEDKEVIGTPTYFPVVTLRYMITPRFSLLRS